MEYKKSQSLSEQVADEILDMIVVKKQFKIGDKLPNETELSALLNVSRTTLREAIKMLVLQDIVEIKRGKGTFVKSDEVDNFTLGNLKSWIVFKKDPSPPIDIISSVFSSNFELTKKLFSLSFLVSNSLVYNDFSKSFEFIVITLFIFNLS